MQHSLCPCPKSGFMSMPSTQCKAHMLFGVVNCAVWFCKLCWVVISVMHVSSKIMAVQLRLISISRHLYNQASFTDTARKSVMSVCSLVMSFTFPAVEVLYRWIARR